MKKYLLVCIYSTFLTGCVASYIPPEANQASAEITFDPGRAHFLNMFTNGKNCSEKRVLPKESNPLLKNYSPLRVPANKEIAFHYGMIASIGSSSVTSCYLITSFTPITDGKYKLVFNTNHEGCSTLVLKLNEDGKYEPESSARKRNMKQPFLESQGFCDDV